VNLKRKMGKAPPVSSEVRRTERIKSNNRGYKPKSCLSKNCFCCSTEGPTLSTKFITNLGSDFYKILVTKLSEDGLKKKNIPKKPAGTRSKQEKSKDKNQVKNDNAPNKKLKK
jgi:hypothetical protein